MNTMTTRIPRKSRLVPLSLTLLTVAAAAGGLPATSPARAMAASSAPSVQDAKPAGLEAAAKSKVTGFELPEGAFRLTDAALLGELNTPLKALAKEAGLTLGATEVLLWRAEGGAKNGELKDAVMYTFKGAGYNYKATDAKGAGDGGDATLFTARQGGGGTGAVLGLWVARDGFLVLAWGSTAWPKAAAAPAPPDKPVLPVPERATPPSPAAAGRTGAVPADLVGGSWSWTTISGVNYQDRITGRLAEPSGMSARYTFLPDGRYKFFFYVRQRTYSLVSESTTTAEGTVTFRDDGTFTVRPTKGHYKGNTGSRIIDRPMTESERKPAVWYWEWRTENGKRELYLGPGPGSMSRFRRGGE